MLDQYSFIYVCGGNVLQIAIGNDYKILFKTKGEQPLDGWGGLVSVRGGEYLIVQNGSGFKVIKPSY